MKFGVLKSIGHNIADSLASGIGLMIGYYPTDVFGEAARTPEGYLDVDFLTGSCLNAQPSPSLAGALGHYREALGKMCEQMGAEPADFRELVVRFSGLGHGVQFLVTVEDQKGRRASDLYVGIYGRRPRIVDPLGRVRRV